MVKLLTKKRYFASDFPFWIRKYKQYTYPVHRHEFLEIFYVWNGEGVHYLGNEKHKIIKGDIFMLNQQQTHKFPVYRNKILEVVTICFSPSLVDIHVSTLKKIPGFFDFAYLAPFFKHHKYKLHLTRETNIKVKFLLEDMVKEFKKKRLDYRLAIKADLLALLVTLSRAYEELEKNLKTTKIMSDRRQSIFDIINYIEKNYQKEIKLKEIARKSYLSTNYFCEVFRKIIGKSLVEYVNELRINKAGKLLRTTNLNITEICYEVGFNDLSHFEHSFKKQTGVSPLKYRSENTPKKNS